MVHPYWSRWRLLAQLVLLLGLLLSVAAPAVAGPELPPGAASSASPPEFNVTDEDQRHFLRYPRAAGPETDDFSWWDFTAYGVPAGRFVVVGARDNALAPNGRLTNGRVLCELAVHRESRAFPHAWTCRTRIGLGSMNRRGTWWTQVAYAECPADGSRCASTSTVRYGVTGVMAPTRPTLPRRRVRVAASHLEASPGAAGGLGFPAAARVPVHCREQSNDRSPGALVVDHDDCQHVKVSLRTVGRISIGGSHPRRWVLGRSTGGGIVVNHSEKVSVLLDTGTANVAQALAIERILRARGRLRVVATVSSKSRWDGRTRSARRVLVLHAPKRRPHGCRTGCLQP